MGKVKKVTGINIAAPVKAVQSGISSIGNATGISPALTKVFQPVEKAVVQPINRGLVSLDKAVGNAIPGGWGTVGTVAASMIPGGQFAALGLGKTAAMTGLGALTGSGVMRPGRSFNLQGALIGGAAAYGASQLADYAAAAGGAEQVAPTVDSYGNLVKSGGSSLVTEPPLGFMDSISQSAGDFGRSLTSSGSDLVTEPGLYDKLASSFTSSGGASDSAFSNLIDPGYADVVRPAAMPPPPTIGERITDFGKSYVQNVSDIGSGIKNLATQPGTAKAVTAATGINPMGAAGATLYGATGLMALDEQEKMLKAQLASQQIAQAEYDQALGEINRQRDYADKIVRENPINPYPNRDVSIGDTLYGRTDADRNLYERSFDPRSTLYAMGGSVDDEAGIDEARGLGLGNLSNGFMNMGSTPTFVAGGMPSYNLALRRMSQPAFNEGAVGGIQQFAAGGEPRFLSGGGDGMSDDIKATINGNQPARLADGEFVIPADVVSHLGNGSSKAGAKQLYSMMDKVRKARTGNPKQGKQINPRKYIPA
jgi:hypothetical protein